MANEHPTKRCTKCETVKPCDAFPRDRSKADGLRSACKACNASRHAAYRAANLDKITAGKAARYAANPDREKARSASYRAANRDEVRARLAAHRAANIDKVRAQKAAHESNKRVAYKAALALVPLVEELRARVAALEALIGSKTNATVDRIAPERPRRRRAVHEHASQAPALPSATPPIIRIIRDIVAHDGVTPAEAKRVQEREILARADWRPLGSA